MAKNNIENPSIEDIARLYASSIDSVNLINGAKPAYMSDAEWSSVVSRNKEHLRIMLAKPWWTTENLTPLQTAAQ